MTPSLQSGCEIQLCHSPASSGKLSVQVGYGGTPYFTLFGDLRLSAAGCAMTASLSSACLTLPRGRCYFHLCKVSFNHLHCKCLWEGADIGMFAASSKWSNARCKFFHIYKWNNLLFISPHFTQLLHCWETRWKRNFASPDPRVIFFWQVSVESQKVIWRYDTKYGQLAPQISKFILPTRPCFCLE